MKPRQSDRKIKAVIAELIFNNPRVTEEQVIELMKAYGFEVDEKKAVQQLWKKKAAGMIARVRDLKNVRVSFAIKGDSGGTEYCNLDTETKTKPVKQVRMRLERQINGTKKAYEKAKRRENTNASLELMSLFPNIKKADG